jgi:hypothetical protein
MFYEQSIISQLLYCKLCKNQFEDPRILPCGNTMCFLCIRTLTKNSSKNYFECISCREHHQICENYPTNETICEILKLQPKNVVHNKQVEDLRIALNTLMEEIEKNEIDENLAEVILKNECLSSRNVVLLRKEELIEQLNIHFDLALKNIENYEIECKKQRPNFQIHKNNKIDPLIKDSKDFLEKAFHFLSQNEIEDSILDIFVKTTNREIEKLRNLYDQTKDLIFAKKKLVTRSNFYRENEKIFEINQIDIDISFLINFSNIQEIELSKVLLDFILMNQDYYDSSENDQNETYHYLTNCFIPFQNEIFIFYIGFISENINACCIDENGIFITQKLGLIKSSALIKVLTVNGCATQDYIYIYTMELRKMTVSSTNKANTLTLSRVRQYDKSLNLVKKKTIETRIIRLVSHGNEIYGHSYQNNKHVIIRFNQNLQMHTFSLPDHINDSSFIIFCINKDRFIIHSMKLAESENTISFLNISNGEVVKKNIGSVKLLNHFSYSNEHFLQHSYDDCSEFLLTYNSHGEIVYEVLIDENHQLFGKQIKCVFKKKLFFFDQKERKVLKL